MKTPSLKCPTPVFYWLACFLQNFSSNGIKPQNNKGDVRMVAALDNLKTNLLIGAISLAPMFGLQAQNTNTSPSSNDNPVENNRGDIQVKKMDLRHEPYRAAGIASCSTTMTREGDAKQNLWITVLVRSDNQALHNSIESTIKGLNSVGHTNVAMMQGSTENGKTEVAIYWDGQAQYILDNAKVSNGTAFEIIRLVSMRNKELGLVGVDSQNDETYVLGK